MKRLTFLLTMMLFAFGIGNAWGATETITLTQSALGLTGSYTTNTKKTIDGVDFTYSNLMKSNDNIQAKASTGEIWNSTELPGNIVSVEVKHSGTARSTTMNFGASAKAKTETSTFSGSKTISPTGDYKYFYITRGSNAAYWTEIVITYETSDGGDPLPEYTIKWHTAVGNTTDETLEEGTEITAPEDPTMTDYKFMGWTEDCEVASDGAGFTAIENFGTATEDKDYYAVFAVATTTGGGTEEKEFTFNITKEDFNTSSYADNNNEKTSTATASDASTMEVKWTSNQVMQQSSVMQWQKNTGYIYNSTDLGTIKSIDISSTAGTFTTYYGTSKQPSSGTTVGNGYFQIKIGSATGKSSNIKVTFTQTVAGGGTTTYSDYITTCASGIEYIELGDDFKWSATEAEVTIDATDNVFPSLTNTHNVPVTYSSTDDAIASIAADGTVTLNKEGTVTITAKYAGGTSAGTDKEYKAKTVDYTLKVNKAAPVASGTTYVKVTSTAGITDGEYLIVYEEGNVAFDGSLATLDAVSNNIAVEISSNTIAGNTHIDAAKFTIDATEGTIKSASGQYIGKTAYENGLDSKTEVLTNTIEISEGNAVITASGNCVLRYNSASGQYRFRYYKSGQQPIALYKKVDASEVLAPAFSVAEGSYYGAQSVEITCATADATIYYTLDGNAPTASSTLYTGAITISETKTLKAIAIKGGNSSSVTEATYTILAPLTTMDAIFAKATEIGKDATQSVQITMDGWVVTGIKNSNVYVTDGTKGFIIYTSDHGFVVGNVLSGTVACDLTIYDGSAEVVGLTSTTAGLSVATGGTVTPVELDEAAIAALTGVNTGSVIKITGPCTVDGTKYYVAGVQLYNSLYTYTNPEEGYNYECTGVYLQYNTTKEILPRKAEDLVKIETQQPAGIKFETTEYTANVNEAFTAPTLTNPNGLTVTYSTSDATLATVNTNTGAVTIGNKTGKVTITASFAGNEDYVAATASYNITISDPSISEATFVAGTDKSEELSISKNGVTVEFTGGTFSRDDNYRCYANQSMTISYNDGQITKIVLAKSSDNSKTPSNFTTEQGTYAYAGSEGVWTGEAKSVTFETTTQVQMNTITVYYKQDTRTAAGLEWSPEAINLTIGDAFTAPTFSNPNSVTGITFASDNEALATVNAGVISLVSGKTGTATITATYAGNETYKPAEVTCVITVSPKSEKVVILAEYNGQWYALKNVEQTAGKVLAALPVNYVGGKLYNVADADKATIEWQLAIDGTVATFKNGENYIFGTAGDTDLKLSTTECEWTFDGTTYMLGNRTFFYNETANGFKNYNTSNAGNSGYSNLPVVTAPVYATGDAYGRTVTTGEYGTICIPFGSNVGDYTGAEFYEISWMEMKEDLSEPKGIWLDQVNGALTAGKPYIFKATADEIAIVGNGTTAATPVEGVAGLTGTFTLIQDIETSDPSNTLEGNYMISGDQFLLCPAGCWLNANRAYIDASIIAGHTTKKAEIPGRRRVCLGETSENEATGFENIVAPEGQAVKAIVNGQLIIIRDGVKYNVQGQKL